MNQKKSKTTATTTITILAEMFKEETYGKKPQIKPKKEKINQIRNAKTDKMQEMRKLWFYKK